MADIPCSNCQIVSLGIGGRGAHLVIPSLIAPILSSCLVLNRLYWRIKLLGRLGLDDYCTILSLVIAVFYLWYEWMLTAKADLPDCPVQCINLDGQLWLWAAYEDLECSPGCRGLEGKTINLPSPAQVPSV